MSSLKPDTEIKTIKIDNLRRKRDESIQWYKIGEEYSVREYRYNPVDYWEISNWDPTIMSIDFWILKDNAHIINKNLFDLPDDLF